ncbi:MAG TPA: Slp family lipoprotein [Gammaproteobacteria bacterium]|nr:Slp family lipoprotein [Gammaproteobacteria bacterium]
MCKLLPVTRFTRHLLLAGLLLAGCTSQIPQNIRQAPPNNPSIEQVRNSALENQIWQVRWGGEILETTNLETATRITVLASPLTKGGEPKTTDNNAGRFIAVVPVFLDPKVYAAGRQLTVSGTLLRFEDHKVGEFDYRYPVVQADAYYLWPERIAPAYGYPYPGWYDPWYYDPWFYRPWYPRRYPYYY